MFKCVVCMSILLEHNLLIILSIFQADYAEMCDLTSKNQENQESQEDRGRDPLATDAMDVIIDATNAIKDCPDGDVITSFDGTDDTPEELNELNDLDPLELGEHDPLGPHQVTSANDDETLHDKVKKAISRMMKV